MEGQLFSSDFLLRGITETEAWRDLPEAELDAFIAALQARFAPFSAASTLNESQTENELVEPILDLLGWENAWLSQVNLSATGRDDVPDFLLFLSAPAKAKRSLSLMPSARGRASRCLRLNVGCARSTAAKKATPCVNRVILVRRRHKCCAICRAPT